LTGGGQSVGVGAGARGQVILTCGDIFFYVEA